MPSVCSTAGGRLTEARKRRSIREPGSRVSVGATMSTPTAFQMLVVLRAALYSSAFVLLWAWLAASARLFDARLPFSIQGWARPLGLALALPGALLVLWCIATFVARGRGTPAPFDPPREFVAAGPYRYVRNPMYIGAFGVLFGAGLILQSPSIVGLAFLFLLLVHLFVLLYEEPVLGSRFGGPYLQYKSSVHRWLPRRKSYLGLGLAILWIVGINTACGNEGSGFFPGADDFQFGSIVARAFDQQGSPVAGATMELRNSRGDLLWGDLNKTGDDGSTGFGPLVPGFYTITIKPPSGYSVPVSQSNPIGVEVRNAQTTTVNVFLLAG